MKTGMLSILLAAVLGRRWPGAEIRSSKLIGRALTSVATLAGLWLGTVLSLHSQSYSIDWLTFDGGGGTSTGGVYAVTGTIGQPDAGRMSGGNFTVDGGFWGVVAAVQTPGAPWLTITLNSQLSTVTVSWPVSETPWQLQATTNLVVSGSVWLGCAFVTNGGNCVYVESSPVGNRFYRLRKP